MGPDTYNLLYNFCANSATLAPKVYYKRLLKHIERLDMKVPAQLACLRTYGHREFEDVRPDSSDLRYIQYLELLEPSLTLAFCNSDFEQ